MSDASTPAAAAQTAAPTAVSQSTTIGSFTAMDIAKQTTWLGSQVNASTFAGWSDEDVLATAHAMKPKTLMCWFKAEVVKLPEYEYRMRRQGRARDQWQGQVALALVCYRNAPRQICIHWFRGDAHTGREIIYDETVCKNEMYGHLDGLIGFMAI